VASTRDALIFTAIAVQTAALGWLVLDRFDRSDLDLQDRITALETAVAEAAQSARSAELATERQQRHVAGLERRVLDVERDLPAPPAAAAADESGDGAPDGARHAATAAEQAAIRARAQITQIDRDNMEAQLAAQTDAVAAKLAEVGIRFKTATLRSLTEDDRWAAARDRLGLNDTQIREIQEATRDRDIEFERATSHEISTDDDGSIRKSVYVDVDIRQAADEAYTERVNRTLTDEQRRKWRGEGFEGAFGVRRPRSSTYVDRRKAR